MYLRAAVLVGLLFGVSYCAYGEPAYETSHEGVRIVLHDDKCTLKEVSNLPRKVVWHENGKEIVGCWGARPDAGLVLMYFSADKTVGIATMSSFRKVTSI
jgi:hypothetical protein